jgi:hypothetical protein
MSARLIPESPEHPGSDVVARPAELDHRDGVAAQQFVGLDGDSQPPPCIRARKEPIIDRAPAARRPLMSGTVLGPV